MFTIFVLFTTSWVIACWQNIYIGANLAKEHLQYTSVIIVYISKCFSNTDIIQPSFHEHILASAWVRYKCMLGCVIKELICSCAISHT